MKEKYTAPELIMIEFECEDVITTSDPRIDPETGLPIL
jgi:hypothetical protein